MAYVFYAAIHRALAHVRDAAPMDKETGSVCEKSYGDGIYAGKTRVLHTCASCSMLTAVLLQGA